MSIEDDLSAAFRAADREFTPSGRDLVHGGLAVGRRMVRKRQMRTAAVSAGTAAVALSVAGIAAATRPGTRSAGVSPGVTVPVASPSSAVTADDMIRILESLLPGGTFSDARGRGSNLLMPGATVVYHAGGGSSEVDVSITRTVSRSQGCIDHPTTGDYHCTRSTLADGSAVLVEKQYWNLAPSGAVVPGKSYEVWSVTMTRPDGRQIIVDAAAGDTTSNPIVSTDRLASIAGSPAWDDALAAVKVLHSGLAHDGPASPTP